MSVGAVCKTSLNDQDMLVASLGEIYGADKVSIVPEGVAVRGYSAARRPTVIIKLPGLYGTAGFCKGADGNFELIYDSTDSRALTKLIPKKKGETVHNYLSQVEARLRAYKGAKAIKGKIVVNKLEEDGSMRLRLKVSSYGDE